MGQFGVSLFPLVPRMRFSQDCLAATLYLVCSLLISQSNNMGDKLLGCVSLVGPSWLGAILGGCVVGPLFIPCQKAQAIYVEIVPNRNLWEACC